MTKLEAIQPQLYKDMHAAHVFLGDTWKHHVRRLCHFLADVKSTTRPILDFGCGPAGGLIAQFADTIAYDPYVPQYHAEPWSKEARTFFSCDVFEHMTIGQLRWVTRRICKQKSLQFLFIALSTRSANKIMPNGMNAHLTVHEPAWWQGFFDYQLGQHFQCNGIEAYLHDAECVFMFTRIPETNRQAAEEPPVGG